MLTQTAAANTARYLTQPATSIVVGQRIERGGMGSARYIVTSMPRAGYLTLGNCEGEDCDAVPECIVRSLPWRVLADVASADEVALATAAVAAKRSARKREQAAAEIAHTAAVARLKTEHPELEVGSCRATAAKNMRTLLKAAFPGVKFSVKQNTGSMVYSITVRWAGGPEGEAVGAVIGRFQSSSWDGMTDSTVSHATAWTDTFGGCSGVTMYRDGLYAR
jgi:hypothetical protein